MMGRPRNNQPPPADFAIHAKREGILKLRKRYRVGGSVIVRWSQETGVKWQATPRVIRSASTARRPKPYSSQPMHKISWYDEDEDLHEVIRHAGINTAWE